MIRLGENMVIDPATIAFAQYDADDGDVYIRFLGEHGLVEFSATKREWEEFQRELVAWGMNRSMRARTVLEPTGEQGNV